MSFERIGALTPKGVRDWTDKQLVYAGMNMTSEFFLGEVLTVAVIIGSIAALIGHYLYSINPLATLIISFALISFIAIFLVVNSADAEGKATEKILPDALELIASNIKAGLNTERALVVSARPEFGSLSVELKFASKRILSGEPISTALLFISKKIKSNVLDRTMWLIAEGIKNGGQIATLLIQLSGDLREENALRAEVNANISMYVLLIFFSATCGAPMLFGISSFIVGILAEQKDNSSISDTFASDYGNKNPAFSLLSGSKTSISESFIVTFVQITLFISCIFSSLVLGIITTGNERGGVKFIPIVMVISFVLFYATRLFVSGMFGGMVR
jgi:flagellar protein FlaJ